MMKVDDTDHKMAENWRSHSVDRVMLKPINTKIGERGKALFCPLEHWAPHNCNRTCEPETALIVEWFQTYCALRIFTWCSLSSKTQRLNGILSTYCQNHFPHSLPWNDTCKETCASTTFHPHFFGLFRSFPSIFLSNPGHLQSPRSKWGRHSSGRSTLSTKILKLISLDSSWIPRVWSSHWESISKHHRGWWSMATVALDLWGLLSVVLGFTQGWFPT